MKLRRFGPTGLLVGELALGTMTFGPSEEGGTVDEATSHRILDAFREAGGNLVDTADVYRSGRSEEFVGSWLAGQDREEVLLATKVRFRTGEGANRVGLTRKHLLHGLSESLRRLRTPYVDLLQLHAFDPLTPLEETFSTLHTLVEEGKVRHVGVSNFRAWQLAKALALCRERGWHPPVSLQPQYSLYARATEFELLPLCRAEGLAVIPWSPIAGGFLSGKYREGIPRAPAGTRIGDAEDRAFYQERFGSVRSERTVNAVVEAAQRLGRTPAQVALNWVLNRPGVTAPLVGVRSREQLDEDLGAAGWTLPREVEESLEAASALEVTYPYDRRADQQQGADRAAP